MIKNKQVLPRVNLEDLLINLSTDLVSFALKTNALLMLYQFNLRCGNPFPD